VTDTVGFSVGELGPTEVLGPVSSFPRRRLPVSRVFPWRLRRRRRLVVLLLVVCLLGLVGSHWRRSSYSPHSAGSFLVVADGRVLGCVRVLSPGFQLSSFSASTGDVLQFSAPGYARVSSPGGRVPFVIWWVDGSVVWGSAVLPPRSLAVYRPTHRVTEAIVLPVALTPTFLPESMTFGRRCVS
jgi:hypothetical protein